MSWTPLTNEQAAAWSLIQDFVYHGEEQVFTVHGLAGVGKSWLLGYAARMLRRKVYVVAPTGKAAHRLHTMQGAEEASTIHNLLLRLLDKTIDERGRQHLNFQLANAHGFMRSSVILADEVSMINIDLGQDLLHSGAKIVAFGDHGQLGPISGAPFFTEPNVVLRDIQRQALDSGIIRQAYHIREHGRYINDLPDFEVFAGNKMTNSHLRDADIILCWTRETRHKLNARKRTLLGFHEHEQYPQAGEDVLCLRNNREFGVFNGAVYTTTQPYDPRDGKLYILIDGKETMVLSYFALDGDDPHDDARLPTFSFGYCLTVHKSQGSEWDYVLYYDEMPRTYHDWKRLTYTAVTRAKRGIVVVQALALSN